MGSFWGKTPLEKLEEARGIMSDMADTLRREGRRHTRRYQEAKTLVDNARYERDMPLLRVHTRRSVASRRLMEHYDRLETQMRDYIAGLDANTADTTVSACLMLISRAVNRVVAATPMLEFNATMLRHEQNLTDLKMRRESADDALAIDDTGGAADDDEDATVEAEVERLLKQEQELMDEQLFESAPNMATVRAASTQSRARSEPSVRR